MRHTVLSCILSVTLLASLASAQYVGEGPALVTPGANFPPLSAAQVGNNVTQIQQYFFRAHSSLPNGVYYVALTVVVTGKADTEVMTGTFDVSTNTFTKNTDADGLNTTASPFAASVSADLRVIAYDISSTATPIYATRAGTTGAFTNPQNMTGVIPAGYVDAHLAMVDGKSAVLYVSGTAISVADFDANTGVTSNPRIVVSTTIGGAQSPFTINDRHNEARALAFSINVSSSSDAYFTSGVHNRTPVFKIHDVTGWINNPGAMGGRVVYADSTTYATNIMVDLCALSSDVVPAAGGTLEFSAFMPPKPSGAPYAGTVVLGILATSGTPLPFAKGSPLSIMTSPIIVLPGGVYNQFTGDLSYSFRTGPLPPGAVVHGVPLAVDGSTLWIGNTGFYHVQ